MGNFMSHSSKLPLPNEKTIDNLGLSVRAMNCLYKMNVINIEQLIKIDTTLLRMQSNVGKKTYIEILNVIQRFKIPNEKRPYHIDITNEKQYPQFLRNVSELELSHRVSKYFQTAGITFIGDLIVKKEFDLRASPNIGRTSLNEIRKALSGIGLSLNTKIKDWPPQNIKEQQKRFSKEMQEIRRIEANKRINKEKKGNFLEDELEAILRIYAKPHNCETLKTLYGWDGSGEKTLESVGSAFAMTREYVRQIRDKFESSFNSGIIRYGDLPISYKVLKIIENNTPSTDKSIQNKLLSENLIRSQFKLDGLFPLYRLLRKKSIFKIYPYKNHRFILSSAYPSNVIRKSLVVALRSASKYGIVNVRDVESRIEELLDINLQVPLIALIISSSRPDFKWLDKENGWFWFDKIPRNRLLNVIRKILSVNNIVDISELRAGIKRFHRMDGVIPPRKILFELCKQLPWCRVDGRKIMAEPALDWDKELKGSIEWAICAIFKKKNSLMTFEQLQEECLAIGMNDNSFKQYASYSPIILRYAPRIYGLIGTEIVPGELNDFVIKNKRERVSSDYGWTEDGNIWLVSHITRGSINFGNIYLPASLSNYIYGEFVLKSSDNYTFGIIKPIKPHVSGLRTFFTRRGAEPGDYIGLLFNLSSKEARAYLGDEALFNKFATNI